MKPAAGRKTAAGFLSPSGGKDGDHEGLPADGADSKADLTAIDIGRNVRQDEDSPVFEQHLGSGCEKGIVR